MKIKILMMPMMLVGMIYLIVWVAVPAYKDPDGIVDIKTKLENSSVKLVDIDQRASNAKKLEAELSQNTQEQKMLFHYLPDKKLNEDVVASLNSIALESGAAIVGLTFKDNKPEIKVKESATVTVKDGMNLNKEMDSPANVAPAKTLSKSFNVNITIVGEYDKVRNFIVSLGSFKRFNGIDMVKMDKKENNLIETTVDMRFDYLEKIAVISVIDSEMFKEDKFNMSIAQEIKDRTNVNITKLEVDSAGRTNPFSL